VFVLVREEPRPVRESRTTLRGLVRDMADDFRYVLGLRALIRLLVAVILVRVLTSSVNPNYARYVEMVGGSRRDVGDLFSVQAICLFASVPLWGRISEVVGPRRVFAWSALLLGLALLGQSRVEGLGGLFVWRALDGVAQGGILPAAYAMALRESAVDRRGSAVGVVFLALALSHAIGAGLGGPLLNILGFKALLATVGATTLAVAVGVAWESRRQRRGGPGPPSRPSPPGPAHGTTTDAGADPSVAHEACPSRRSGDTAPAG
jgi:DHA1 family multidrug resistance protein-like MFS transporter